MPVTVSVKVENAVKLPTSEVLLGVPTRGFAKDLVNTGVGHLNLVTPIDKGRLRGSLQEGATLTRIVGDPVTEVVFGTNLPYARMLNEGATRGPGKAPPVAEIERWIERRKISPTKTRGKKQVRDNNAKRSMAFAIARKIARQGVTPPTRYVAGRRQDESVRGWFDSLRDKLEQEMQALTDKLADGIAKAWSTRG